ncbi:hypothetical protein M2167_008283 [Streptomyces sp. SPB4]|nr:hypothetical protein [Streptomyces sp. SPB4]MDH6545705.1 hypothetical protein [Streptomyces sp. SPB4]
MPVDHEPDTAAPARALRAEVDGEFRFAGSRRASAADSSNHRQVPLGVVVPRSVEDGATAVAVPVPQGSAPTRPW